MTNKMLNREVLQPISHQRLAVFIFILVLVLVLEQGVRSTHHHGNCQHWSVFGKGQENYDDLQEGFDFVNVSIICFLF